MPVSGRDGQEKVPHEWRSEGLWRATWQQKCSPAHGTAKHAGTTPFRGENGNRLLARWSATPSRDVAS
jgi:hypothetical protein